MIYIRKIKATIQRLNKNFTPSFSTKQIFVPTEEQKSFIECESKNNISLIGVAGSGKTITMLKRINYLIQTNKASEKEILALTFSRNTKHDILNKIQAYNNNKMLRQNVRTLDSLAREVLIHSKKDYKNISLLSMNFLTLLECEFEIVKPFLDCYRYIFVDEAQDLRETQIKILENLAKKNDSILCLVGDPCQTIYQYLGADPSFLVNFSSEEYYLTKNFRSSPNIAAFSNYFRSNYEAFTQKISLSLPLEKNKDIEVIVSTSKKIEERLLKLLQEYQNDLSRVAIISPIINSRNSPNIGLSWVSKILNYHKIPFLKHYKEGSSNRNTDYYRERGHLNLLTYSGAKGMEWDMVILMDFSLFHFGYLPTQKEYEEALNLMYVATTRGRKKLVIFHKTDTGLSAEKNVKIEINKEKIETQINVSDILSQFRESSPEQVDESNFSDEDENNILKNMIHPRIKIVPQGLYNANITGKKMISNMEFDINWLEQQKTFSGSLGVTELITLLSDDKINTFLTSPNIKLHKQENKIVPKPEWNFEAIYYNEILGGIIGENLLNLFMKIEGVDYINNLLNENYIVCEDYSIFNSLRKIFYEIKSWNDVISLYKQKKISNKEFQVLKNYKENLPSLIIDKYTHNTVKNHMGKIKKLKKNEDSNYTNLLQHNIANSLIGFALKSGEVEYISNAESTSTRFINNNQNFIETIRKIADIFLRQKVQWRTQVEVHDENGLTGMIDLITNSGEIYEIKTANSLTNKYVLQALIYTFLYQSQNKLLDINKGIYRANLVNILDGTLTQIEVEASANIIKSFLDENLNVLFKIPQFPIYLYSFKHNNQGLIYKATIRELTNNITILDTYIRHKNFTPNLDSESLNEYAKAPLKYAIQTQIQKLVTEDSVFFSLFDCDSSGDLLTQLSDLPVLVIELENFIKETSLNLLEIEGVNVHTRLNQIKTLQTEKQIDETSNLLRKILPLAKGFIEEYRSTLYIST